VNGIPIQQSRRLSVQDQIVVVCPTDRRKCHWVQ
jgi:hypothetical protein